MASLTQSTTAVFPAFGAALSHARHGVTSIRPSGSGYIPVTLERECGL